jgi:predicted restriction endonuclease
VLLLEEATIVDGDALDAVASRTDIGETQKQQLILVRRGQGLFRTGIYQVEQRCRLTHVSEKIHLVASHIKPWAASSDEERLDRFNGLLLSPHADHLFDRGWLSFTNSGDLIVSKRLDHQVLEYWNLDPGMNVGPFHREQQAFLDYHRDAVLIH